MSGAQRRAHTARTRFDSLTALRSACSAPRCAIARLSHLPLVPLACTVHRIVLACVFLPSEGVMCGCGRVRAAGRPRSRGPFRRCSAHSMRHGPSPSYPTTLTAPSPLKAPPRRPHSTARRHREWPWAPSTRHRAIGATKSACESSCGPSCHQIHCAVKRVGREIARDQTTRMRARDLRLPLSCALIGIQSRS